MAYPFWPNPRANRLTFLTVPNDFSSPLVFLETRTEPPFQVQR